MLYSKLTVDGYGKVRYYLFDGKSEIPVQVITQDEASMLKASLEEELDRSTKITSGQGQTKITITSKY